MIQRKKEREGKRMKETERQRICLGDREGEKQT